MSKEQTTHEQVDARTVRTVYRKAGTTVTVTSSFNGTEKLEDLFFEIIKRKLDARMSEDTAN